MSDFRDEGDAITAELLKRVDQGEVEASHEFFQLVFPMVLAALDRALTRGERDIGKEARRLVKEAYRDDLPGAIGAIGSAWDSFLGHFLKKDRPPDEMRTAADCAGWLIGVAYNRWQRERYQTRRSQAQQALGASVAQGGSGPSLLERTPRASRGARGRGRPGRLSQGDRSRA
jgi:hypothetical protein